MWRFEKCAIEEKKGSALESSMEAVRRLIIRTSNIAKTNTYSENYVNPPILEGYKHICGEWHNGFTIERCSDASKFVWIPVGSLEPNGTLDGENFSEKFGRRNYQNDVFASYAFNEPLNAELLEQLKSVKKYGGFYITSHNISESSEGKPQSVKGAMPWVSVNFYEAKEIASNIEDNKAVKSHLTFGAEYDSVLAWIIKSGAKTFGEVVWDSTEWGNYYNTDFLREIAKTGSKEKYSANNIYDMAGNLKEWTQEQYGDIYRVKRGGSYFKDGDVYPVAYRSFDDTCGFSDSTGFRAALYIK